MIISINTSLCQTTLVRLILIVATVLLIYNHLKWNYIIIHWKPKNNDISCHFSFTNDSLPIFRNSSKAKSFFFHETSCRGGLNSRQACAVESAAKAHPRRLVHVLFSSPVTLKVLQYSNLAVLKTYPNVILSRVDFEKHTDEEYPLGLFEALKTRTRPVEDTADLLKIMTLQRFGGVYLDLDVIVVRSFKNLSHNFVAKQAGNNLAFNVMALKNTGFGRSISKKISREISKNYNPYSMTSNGPDLISRALKKICPAAVLPAGRHCYGFYIYGPELFYPMYYRWAMKYFAPGNLSDVDNGHNPYVHHMWNGLTWNLKVHKDSPYAKLAKEFCPRVYEMYGDEFGV